jgi:molybdopterin-guanine dinucleotide biosynthesis protein A
LTPVVLVGGKSVRFGRDKLREPWGDGVLVERPIGVLREVFGARVMVVGACDARVRALGDGEIADGYAGVGPMGGVVSALEGCGGAVFVLAGDMPGFCAERARELVRVAAGMRGEVEAVLCETDRLQVCAGIYERRALARLRGALDEGRYSLVRAMEGAGVARVRCEEGEVRNVNTPGDVSDG